MKVLQKVPGEELPIWVSGPRITVERIALAVDLVEQLNDDDLVSPFKSSMFQQDVLVFIILLS
jgi:hypothetical protein